MSAENERVLKALQRLATSLKDLPSNDSPPHLSHWRNDRPEALATAWQVLEQGNQLVEATCTKYTLVTKIDVQEGSKLAKDLLRGCEVLGTAALVAHDNAVGCSRSMRKHLNHAVRGVVNTCIALIQLFCSANEDKLVDAAPKTGAVWDACKRVTKVPNNNRNAMRRDLLTWMVECQETLQEFTDLLNINSTAATDDTTWEMFCSGQAEMYSLEEQPIALACLGLIKCSRGSINTTLKACESVGNNIGGAQEDDGCRDKTMLAFVSKLHSLARRVGDGMTDLGSLLYAPLELEELQEEAASQVDAILELHSFLKDECEASAIDLPAELIQLSSNISRATATRSQEAQDGIEALLKSCR